MIREVRPRTGCSTCPWKNAPLEKSNKYNNFLGERSNSTILYNHTSAVIVHLAQRMKTTEYHVQNNDWVQRFLLITGIL